MIKITKINQYKHLLQPINKNQLNEVIFKLKDYDRYDTIKLDKFNTPQEELEFILGETKQLTFLLTNMLRCDKIYL